MILTKEQILKEVQFEPPLDVFQVNPHSIDVRIDSELILKPGERKTYRTLEKITLPPNVMAVLYPRSSTNRKGLTVDMTGVVDASYSGKLIIPITNNSKLQTSVPEGTRVASLIFHRLEQEAEVRLSKYHNAPADFVPDKSEEDQLLIDGRLHELKEKFSV